MAAFGGLADFKWKDYVLETRYAKPDFGPGGRGGRFNSHSYGGDYRGGFRGRGFGSRRGFGRVRLLLHYYEYHYLFLMFITYHLWNLQLIQEDQKSFYYSDYPNLKISIRSFSLIAGEKRERFPRMYMKNEVIVPLGCVRDHLTWTE